MIPTQKIIYINNDIENGKIIEWDRIHKLYMKLKPPEHVYHVDLPWDKSNMFVLFSKRDTGKTTNVLLHALIAYVEYGVKLEWIRQRDDMIKPTNTTSMFDTIIKFDYISKITKGKYSAVYYYRKEMFLCNYDGKKGKPEDCDTIPFMRFNSIDNMHEIKSNYTSPDGDLIVLDEFQTSTTRENEFADFFHIISTIRRHRISTKVLLLGNTITPYNYYFREMDITKYIIKMKPNTRQIIRNKKGMYIYLEWLEPTSTDIKYNERRRNDDIQYYGFDGLNSITGGGWDVESYPHITSELDKNKKVIDNMYIQFQLFTLNMKICIDDTLGTFVYIRPCSQKTLDNAREKGNIIFVDRTPERKNEVYGTGQKQYSSMSRLWALNNMQRFLYSTNDVGELVAEFIKTFK